MSMEGAGPEPGAGHGEGAEPVVRCPRHGPVERPLPCTRCGRPSCPQCLIPAAVGSHCPDCVREGNRGQRTARNPFGGVSRAGWRVSTVLVAVNVAVWLAQQSGVTIGGQGIEQRFALINVFVAQGDWWRLLTGTLLHASLLHVAFNMGALAIFGPQVEGVMGRARFAALYFLAALGGSAASYALGPALGSSVGASGAIFGVFAAYFIIARKVGVDTGPIVVLLGINLALSFAPHSNIDWRAHVGGLVTGAAAAAVMAAVPVGRNRWLFQTLALAGLFLVIVAVIVYRTSTFPLVG